MYVQCTSDPSLSRPSQDMHSELNQYATYVLTSRSSYKSCHILTGDHEFRLPAIQFEGIFYSLFKVEDSEDSAVKTLKKLHSRGEVTIATVIPKGYAIWILESEAIAIPTAHDDHQGIDSISQPSTRRPSSIHPKQRSEQVKDTPDRYQILTSHKQYVMGKAYIRGLDRPVSVVYFKGQYYYLFKTVQDIKQTAQIVKKIAVQGNRTVVTRIPRGYGIWILEESAKPIEEGPNINL